MLNIKYYSQSYVTASVIGAIFCVDCGARKEKCSLRSVSCMNPHNPSSRYTCLMVDLINSISRSNTHTQISISIILNIKSKSLPYAKLEQLYICAIS